MLPKKALEEIKEHLDNCKNPLFIYDDDCDGLCSFLILYKYKREGNGIPRKTKAVVSAELLGQVEKYQPDKVFILDIPNIDEEFIEGVKVPIIQIDHHLTDNENKGIKKYVTRNFDKNDSDPTSAICYNVVKQNLWICATGTIADWHLTKETKKFAKEKPKLLDIKIKDPGKAYFESKIGLLGRMFNLLLKGRMDDIRKSVNELIKINYPEEILDQKTEEGKSIYKRYLEMNSEYKEIYNRAEKQITKDKLFLFVYPGSESTFTADISNELTFNHPDKYVIVARLRNGEYKCSIRSGKYEVREKLLKALKGIDGHGGGHSKACGAGIKEHDFERFIENFRKLM